MNIIIGIAILLTLMLSDNSSAPESVNIAARLCGLILLTALAPFTSAVLVFLNERKPSADRCFEQEMATARFTSSMHTAIWFVASLAIVLVLGWQDVVRYSMGFDGWVFVDEALIIAPMLISLIVSWAIFFEQQSHDIPMADRRRAMRQYVGLRCRVYLLMVLVPIVFVILIKDFWVYLQFMSPALAAILALLAVVAMLMLMPEVIRMMWTNRSISEDEGRSKLLALCNEHRMTVSDIKVWDTNNQIVNALVAGLVPRMRILMVTDLLLASFPTHELKAVLRHEAGHVRLRHLQKRLGFIMLPAIALLGLEMDPNATVEQCLGLLGVTTGATFIIGLVFFAYVVWVTTWLSRNMEFEADLYAIGAIGQENSQAEVEESGQSMADALLRFADQNPDQLSRGSITHPSLMERIELIKSSRLSTATAKAFQRRFQIGQIALAFAIVTVMVGIILV